MTETHGIRKVTRFTKIWFAFSISEAYPFSKARFSKSVTRKLPKRIQQNFQDYKIQINKWYSWHNYFSSCRLKGVITDNNRPRKGPKKVARPKEATSTRAVSGHAHTQYPCCKLHASTQNLGRAQDALIRMSRPGSRNRPWETHHQEAWQPEGARRCWDRGLSIPACKGEWGGGHRCSLPVQSPHLS